MRFLGLEQVTGPQAVDKLLPREDGYAIDFAWAWFVGDEYAVAERALVADGAKPLEVVLRCVARRFGLNRNLAVHDEIDFKVRARAPVGDFRIAAECFGVGHDLVHDPAFEGVSVFGRSANEFPSPREAACHACVEQVELCRLDRLAGTAFVPYWRGPKRKHDFFCNTEATSSFRVMYMVFYLVWG